MSLDHEIRIAAFDWLKGQVALNGDVLPRRLLAAGFVFSGQRITLVSPQGIFRPKGLDYPLTITTTPEGPYDDKFNAQGLLRYRYRGENHFHRDNIGLREAMKNKVPLIYLYGVMPGRYMAVWPVYIMADDPGNLTFMVAVDDASMVREDRAMDYELAEPRRAYITSLVKIRLHQRGFRERVIDAYRTQCAFCKLKHEELLDAAHIIPDTEPESRPSVNNGIALCKLHHAAFDSFILGVSPEYVIEVRADVLEEHDGPMLQHGIKELHRQRIILPRKAEFMPDRGFLDWRYQKFRAAVI
jgi:putative restriction endonuclease